jgi:hypothetical protein
MDIKDPLLTDNAINKVHKFILNRLNSSSNNKIDNFQKKTIYNIIDDIFSNILFNKNKNITKYKCIYGSNIISLISYIIKIILSSYNKFKPHIIITNQEYIYIINICKQLLKKKIIDLTIINIPEINNQNKNNYDISNLVNDNIRKNTILIIISYITSSGNINNIQKITKYSKIKSKLYNSNIIVLCDMVLNMDDSIYSINKISADIIILSCDYSYNKIYLGLGLIKKKLIINNIDLVNKFNIYNNSIFNNNLNNDLIESSNSNVKYLNIIHSIIKYNDYFKNLSIRYNYIINIKQIFISYLNQHISKVMEKILKNNCLNNNLNTYSNPSLNIIINNVNYLGLSFNGININYANLFRHIRNNINFIIFNSNSNGNNLLLFIFNSKIKKVQLNIIIKLIVEFIYSELIKECNNKISNNSKVNIKKKNYKNYNNYNKSNKKKVRFNSLFIVSFNKMESVNSINLNKILQKKIT